MWVGNIVQKCDIPLEIVFYFHQNKQPIRSFLSFLPPSLRGSVFALKKSFQWVRARREFYTFLTNTYNTDSCPFRQLVPEQDTKNKSSWTQILPVGMNERIEGQPITPAFREVLHIYIGIAGSFMLTPD